MRTHFLNRLDVPGREQALALEPDFDLYRAHKALAVHIEFGTSINTLPSLRLDLEYDAGATRYELTLLFEGVLELLLPAMTPSLFLPEMEIEDVSDRQLEGIRFEVISHFDRGFRCTCRDISILEFKSLRHP